MLANVGVETHDVVVSKRGRSVAQLLHLLEMRKRLLHFLLPDVAVEQRSVGLVVLVLLLEGFEVGFRGDEAVDSAHEVEVDGVFRRGKDAYTSLVHPFRNLEGVEEAFAFAEIVHDADELGDGDFVARVNPVLEFWVDA